MSSLMRWRPFVGPLSLQRDVRRLLEDAFARPSLFKPIGLDLALDMYETDDDLVVKVTVPGVSPEDIQITVTGDNLTIKGESKMEQEVEEHNYVRRERSYGAFCRSITLPGNVNVDETEAEFQNGILTLTVPKVEEAKRKSIRVKVK